MNPVLRRLPLVVCVVLSVVLFSHTVSRNSDTSSVTPTVEAMRATYTLEGPVVTGLFERFPWGNVGYVAVGCGTRHARCGAGQTGTPACESGREEHIQCLLQGCLTASDCGAPKHNNDCCCSGCTQTVYPCTGCSAVGSCT